MGETLPPELDPANEPLDFLARQKHKLWKGFRWSRPTMVAQAVRLAHWLYVAARRDEALKLASWLADRLDLLNTDDSLYAHALTVRLQQESGEPGARLARLGSAEYHRSRLSGSLLEKDPARKQYADLGWELDERLSELMEQILVVVLGASPRLPMEKVEGWLRDNLARLRAILPDRPARGSAVRASAKAVEPSAPLSLPRAMSPEGESHATLLREKRRVAKDFKFTARKMQDVAYLAYLLHALGRNDEALEVANFLSAFRFDGDYNKWTWVEGCLALQSRLDSRGARRAVRRLQEPGFVEDRLEGILMEAPRESAADARACNDPRRELDWLVVLAQELCVCMAVGKERNRAKAAWSAQLERTLERIRELAG